MFNVQVFYSHKKSCSLTTTFWTALYFSFKNVLKITTQRLQRKSKLQYQPFLAPTALEAFFTAEEWLLSKTSCLSGNLVHPVIVTTYGHRIIVPWKVGMQLFAMRVSCIIVCPYGKIGVRNIKYLLKQT